MWFQTYFIDYFWKGKNASQANKELCAIYGNEALKERQCHNWFAKFCFGNFLLKHAQQSDHPVKVDESHIKAIINSYHHNTTREIAEKLNVLHTCIKNFFKQLGYVKKLNLWIPHQLQEIHLIQCINIFWFASEMQQNWFIMTILTLPERWQNVIVKNKQYLIK